jgi:hypothetical protein
MRILRHAHSGRDIITVCPRSKIKITDLFNANDLVKSLHDWLCDNGWGDRSDSKFPEIFYLHRNLQKDGEEVKIWWLFEKEVNKFFKYEMFVDILILGMRSTEAMYNGIKFKTNRGYIEICVESYLEMDFENKWRTHPFLKNFYELYKKRIIPKEIEMHKITLNRMTELFRTNAKNYFQVKGFFYPQTDDDFNYRQDFN